MKLFNLPEILMFILFTLLTVKKEHTYTPLEITDDFLEKLGFEKEISTKDVPGSKHYKNSGQENYNIHLFPQLLPIHFQCLQQVKQFNTDYQTCLIHKLSHHTDYGKHFLHGMKIGKMIHDIDDNIKTSMLTNSGLLLCLDINSLIRLNHSHSEESCFISQNPLEAYKLYRTNWTSPLYVATIGTEVYEVNCGLEFLSTDDTLERKFCMLPYGSYFRDEVVRPLRNCNSLCPQNSQVSPVIELDFLPSKSEFNELAKSNRPIIVRRVGNLTGIPNEFGFFHLKRIFDETPGSYKYLDQNCQFLRIDTPFTSVLNALSLIAENKNLDPWYFMWEICNKEVSKKLEKIFPKANFVIEVPYNDEWIWMSSPEIGFQTHIDYVAQPLQQAQFSGSKLWDINPPPECRYFCPEQISFIVNAGDMVFIPTNTWYHSTFAFNGSDSISIARLYDFVL